MNRNLSVHCEEISRELWEEREYRFTKNASLAKSDFEEIAKIFVGWSDDVEMEISFTYMLNDTVCYVCVRERVE
jgi:hypothetical protein